MDRAVYISATVFVAKRARFSSDIAILGEIRCEENIFDLHHRLSPAVRGPAQGPPAPAQTPSEKLVWGRIARSSLLRFSVASRCARSPFIFASDATAVARRHALLPKACTLPSRAANAVR